MVDLFIQGLRRSGTTFLYDVLLSDPRFDGYYEPLAEATRPAVGGGSKVSEVDFYEKIRDVRKRYGETIGLSDLTLLNFGAPRDASLELEREFSPEVLGYIRFMCAQREFTVLKFVRAWRKLPALIVAFPKAFVVHIVRDPRAVVTSFLFGKGQKNKDQFKTADDFFTFGGDVKRNQGLQIANLMIDRKELPLERTAPHAAKLLGTWKHHFRSTHDDGVKILGPERYFEIRHEEFVRAPEITMEQIYARIGQSMPDSVRAFLREKVDSKPRIFAETDPRWIQFMKQLAMGGELADAGYVELAEAVSR